MITSDGNVGCAYISRWRSAYITGGKYTYITGWRLTYMVMYNWIENAPVLAGLKLVRGLLRWPGDDG